MRFMLPRVAIVTAAVFCIPCGHSGAIELLIPPGRIRTIRDVAFSADGRRLVVGRHGGTERGEEPAACAVWDLETGRRLSSINVGAARGRVAISPDGRRLLMAGTDPITWLRDAGTGTPIRKLEGHTEPIRAVVIAADGRTALTGAEDRTARLWDVATGRTLQTLSGHLGAVVEIALAPVGPLAATCSEDGAVRIWDTSTGRERHRLAGHDGAASCVAFSPDGRRVVTGGIDKTARLWDAATGAPAAVLGGHDENVSCVAFSPDGRRVVTGSEDRTVRIWDAETGQPLLCLRGHTRWLETVAVSPDGRFVLSGGGDGVARLWDASDGHSVCRLIDDTRRRWAVVEAAGRFDTSDEPGVLGLCWDLRGEAIPLAVLGDRYLDRGLLAKLLDRGPGPVRAVPPLAGSGLFPEVRLSQPTAADPRLRVDLIDRGGGFGRVAVRINGQDLHPAPLPVAAASDPSRMRVEVSLARDPRIRPGATNRIEVTASNAANSLTSWARSVTFETGDSTAPPGDAAGRPRLAVQLGHANDVTALAFSPDGRCLLTGGSDANAILWDLATGREVRRFVGHAGELAFVGFSPGGRLVVTGSADKTARIWDAADGRELGRFQGHYMGVRWAALAPDGGRLLTASADNTARIWDVKTREEIRRLKAGSDLISLKTAGSDLVSLKAAVFSPDGRLVLTVGTNGSAQLWDAETGNPLRGFQWHSNINAVTVSPDGQRVLTGSDDHTARVWDLATGDSLRVFSCGGPVVWGAFSPEDRRALTGRGDGQIQVWDLLGDGLFDDVPGAEREPRLLPIRLTVNSPHAALAPDGQTIAVTSGAGVRVRDLTAGPSPRILEGRTEPVSSLACSRDGRWLRIGGRLFDLRSGREARSGEAAAENAFAFARPSQATPPVGGPQDGADPILARSTDLRVGLIRGDDERPDRLRDPSTGEETPLVPVADPQAPPINKADAHWTLFDPTVPESTLCGAFSPDGVLALTGSTKAVVRVWEVATGREVRAMHGHAGAVRAIAFGDDRHAWTAGDDHTTRCWDLKSGSELCRLVLFRGGGWAVVAPDGRFDTDDLDEIRGLSWVFPDDAFRPLSPETFLRDYFEPRLLPRLLAGEPLPTVRPLAELNRVGPAVRIVVPPQEDRGRALVTVEVAADEGTYLRSGRPVTMRTGVYDVRLFRDGQLVGRWPEPAPDADAQPEPDPTSPEQMDRWRCAHRATDGTDSHSFPVRLPHPDRAGAVTFTAYAFNEDRVKSATASVSYPAPAHPLPRKPRAYLIAMGVDACQTRRWDLRYAAADAHLVLRELGDAIQRAGRYEVVPVPLISRRRPGGGLAEVTATKAHLYAALARLAGAEAAVPGGESLQAATPDDLVLVTFSGHGYTDPRGQFYLVPYDVGGELATIDAALPNCISAAELSGWLRPVDAGQLALVVDACHSAAAIQQEGFKPGPLGGRGLGQLAYDKGMRVLAASQADATAQESRRLRQGLLTYALVRDGLGRGRAARDGVVTLGGLLAYAAERVPGLAQDVRAGRVPEAAGRGGPEAGAEGDRQLGAVGGETGAAQRPELFDYARQANGIVLAR